MPLIKSMTRVQSIGRVTAALADAKTRDYIARRNLAFAQPIRDGERDGDSARSKSMNLSIPEFLLSFNGLLYAQSRDIPASSAYSVSAR